MKKHITQIELHELVNYNPHTGIMTWKKDMYPRGKKDAQIGGINSAGYWTTSIKGDRYLVHRLVWIYCFGSFIYDSIDHIDHNPLNNRIENLRECSHKQNLKNRKVSSNSTSGYHGVSFIKSSSKWRAYITVNDKQIRLGNFKNKEDAISARKHADKIYGFHNNHGKHP